MLELRQIEAYFPAHLRAFKRNLLREYLQFKLLEILFDSPAGDRLAFMGGTAIHILHGAPRFSEDLDFDDQGLNEPEAASVEALVRSRLERQGFSVETRFVRRTACRIFIRFPGLFRAYGLSTDPREKMHLRIDFEPQRFEYEVEAALIDKFDVFSRVRAVPADVLLAQKVACLFLRPRPMGRDVYDAMFLWGKTEPRLDYLTDRLGVRDGRELREKLVKRCGELNFDALASDVAPFLFRPEEAAKVRLFPDFVRTRDF